MKKSWLQWISTCRTAMWCSRFNYSCWMFKNKDYNSIICSTFFPSYNAIWLLFLLLKQWDWQHLLLFFVLLDVQRQRANGMTFYTSFKRDQYFTWLCQQSIEIICTDEHFCYWTSLVILTGHFLICFIVFPLQNMTKSSCHKVIIPKNIKMSTAQVLIGLQFANKNTESNLQLNLFNYFSMLVRWTALYLSVFNCECHHTMIISKRRQQHFIDLEFCFNRFLWGGFSPLVGRVWTAQWFHQLRDTGNVFLPSPHCIEYIYQCCAHTHTQSPLSPRHSKAVT